MHRFALVAVAILFSAVLPTTAAAAAPATTDRVTARVDGHTYVLLGPSVFGVTVQQDPLAYSAVKLSDGTVRGHWSYHYYEAGVETTFSGPISCLTVHGDRAWVGGPITQSTDPPRSEAGAGGKSPTTGLVHTRSSPTARRSSASAPSSKPRHIATPHRNRGSSSTSSKAGYRSAPDSGPSGLTGTLTVDSRAAMRRSDQVRCLSTS